MSLFLAPADPVNARRSLSAPVDRRAVAAALRNERQYAALMEETGTRGKIYCWAARERKRGTWKKMTKGDDVLFTLRGTGKFNFHGIVAATLESPSFATRFWEDLSLSDWKYIYFLKDLRQISIDKGALAKRLRYDENDRVQGLRPVAPERLKAFASVTALIASLADATETVTSPV